MKIQKLTKDVVILAIYWKQPQLLVDIILIFNCVYCIHQDVGNLIIRQHSYSLKDRIPSR